MSKLNMFSTYKKKFWGMIAFLILLGLGVIIALGGIIVGISFLLGIVFSYVLIKWDEEEEIKEEE